jgi:hypothetical protein
MLSVGSFPPRDCQGVSRRAFVRAGLAAPFVMSAAQAADSVARLPAR